MTARPAARELALATGLSHPGLVRALLHPDDLRTLVHLLAALAAGSAIGLERSWHGRPAGFRTHALVCLASSLLLLLTLYQPRWFPGAGDSVRLDPTRMAQGIMTGIGFLGAGVIFKEGLSVRGLTTAASIWITSAIGVLMGSGLWFAGATATINCAIVANRTGVTTSGAGKLVLAGVACNSSASNPLRPSRMAKK